VRADSIDDGARGTRTPDLSAASRTLSQLSYSPELVVASKVNAGALAIPRRLQTEMQHPLAFRNLDRNEERFLQLPAVNGACVDLIRGIGARHVPVRSVPRSPDPNADHTLISVDRSPLALDSQDLLAQIEREVVGSTVTDV
jgi:hypothetical protein